MVLGGSIAIPAAVVFFGVTGVMAVAQSGSFTLGFATMPVVFQQLPAGQLLGAFWFGLLFLAGITSSVAMLTPILAFFREEFGVPRERAAVAMGVVTFVFGLMHIMWLEHGFLDEWDYWAGTFGLVVLAVIETVLFMRVFGPANAWRSIHQGADVTLPAVFKFVMTFVTPIYLLVILCWWGVTDAWPLLRMERVSEEAAPYVLLSRGVIVLFAITFIVLIRLAWRRNGYDDRAGFAEVGAGRAGISEVSL